VPTLLMIGERDTTAIGKNRAPAELAKRLGNYAELGRRTAGRISGSVLVTFPDLGHSPQVQAPERFNAALLENLGQVSAQR
jgi:pimeloyl-ACP methyl ester carboxylesterase